MQRQRVGQPFIAILMIFGVFCSSCRYGAPVSRADGGRRRSLRCDRQTHPDPVLPDSEPSEIGGNAAAPPLPGPADIRPHSPTERAAEAAERESESRALRVARRAGGRASARRSDDGTGRRASEKSAPLQLPPSVKSNDAGGSETAASTRLPARRRSACSGLLTSPPAPSDAVAHEGRGWWIEAGHRPIGVDKTQDDPLEDSRPVLCRVLVVDGGPGAKADDSSNCSPQTARSL